MRCVVGIDPSMTGFAMVAMFPGGRTIEKEMTSKPDPTLQGRMDRFRKLANDAADFLKEHVPELCLIEGYAYGAKGRSVISLGELGGIVRDRIISLADVTVEVAPGTLKRFVTGRGNASKMDVMQKLIRRYDREFKSDNIADAFGLALIGAVMLEYRSAATQYETDAVGVVRGQIP